MRDLFAYRHNKLDQVRPGNRFETFQALHPSQDTARQMLEDLADNLIENGAHVLGESHPFDHAILLFLHGLPGRGKTHLVEAFVNRIRERAPKMLDKMILSRGRFMHDFMEDNPFREPPVVIIDDMFQEHHSVSDLHPRTDIAAFMKFITDLYNNKRLVIVTSNFAMLAGGIMEKVSEVDTIGRISSRAAEVLSRAGEFELLGDDYRLKLAAEAAAQGGGKLVLPFKPK